MKIVKDWTTVELMEFLNSYKNVSEAEQGKYNELMVAVRDELALRQPLIGMIYK
jgi:hypothetical protein